MTVMDKKVCINVFGSHFVNAAAEMRKHQMNHQQKQIPSYLP